MARANRGTLGILVVCAVLFGVLIWLDAIVARRASKQHGRISVLDYTQPAGYSAERTTEAELSRSRIREVLVLATDPSNPLELDHATKNVLAENVMMLHHQAYDLLWCSHRLLEDL
ncbi:MAG: hypothetical protein FJX76_06555 [Armatimonadetes bacterium]|nr:hypothetical protein [Armatimonadota bacterium]